MSYRFRVSAVLCVSLVVLYASDLSADTLNVPADHATIQAAIDAASDGDEVIVAPGAYVETINFNGESEQVYYIHTAITVKVALHASKRLNSAGVGADKESAV